LRLTEKCRFSYDVVMSSEKRYLRRENGKVAELVALGNGLVPYFEALTDGLRPVLDRLAAGTSEGLCFDAVERLLEDRFGRHWRGCDFTTSFVILTAMAGFLPSRENKPIWIPTFLPAVLSAQLMQAGVGMTIRSGWE